MEVYISRRDLPIVEEQVFDSVPKDLRFVILIHAETFEAPRNNWLTYGSYGCVLNVLFFSPTVGGSSEQSSKPWFFVLYWGLYYQAKKGMIINHYMDPYKPIRISWNVIRVVWEDHQLRDPYSHSHQLHWEDLKAL